MLTHDIQWRYIKLARFKVQYSRAHAEWSILRGDLLVGREHAPDMTMPQAVRAIAAFLGSPHTHVATCANVAASSRARPEMLLCACHRSTQTVWKPLLFQNACGQHKSCIITICSLADLCSPQEPFVLRWAKCITANTDVANSRCHAKGIHGVMHASCVKSSPCSNQSPL